MRFAAQPDTLQTHQQKQVVRNAMESTDATRNEPLLDLGSAEGKEAVIALTL